MAALGSTSRVYEHGQISAFGPCDVFLGVVIGWYLWWRVRERHNVKKGVTERRVIVDRLLRPDWRFYEGHLRRPAPTSLRELYADQSLITIAGLDYDKKYKISTFNPVDENGLLDTRAAIGCDIVALANSDCGDPIYLRPGSAESDTVYITHHDDSGHVEVFAESVAVMLEKLRRENTPSGPPA